MSIYFFFKRTSNHLKTGGFLLRKTSLIDKKENYTNAWNGMEQRHGTEVGDRDRQCLFKMVGILRNAYKICRAQWEAD